MKKVSFSTETRVLGLLVSAYALALSASCGSHSEGGTSASTKPNGAGEESSWCDVKALLDANCIECHDGEGTAGAPMALLQYDDLLADAPLSKGKKVYQAIADRIHDKKQPMPPKGALPADQLALLDDWIAAKAPAGEDTACEDTESERATDSEVEDIWPPPEGCDEIYPLISHGAGADDPFMVDPGGEQHPQIVIDAPWGDEDVQAVAFHPITDNKKVLHHWILYTNQGLTAAFLVGWAPGDDARSPLPPDVGMDMPKGKGALRLDIHYNSLTASTAQADRSGVEVCVVKGAHMRPKHAGVTMSFNALKFPLAPANTSNFEATGTCSVMASEPVHLLTAGPHSHTYAVAHRFTVTKKSGEQLVMLDQPFQFGEQKTYPLKKEIILETGDTVTTTCVYTNTTNRGINFGENTADEMCFNFAAYYPKEALSCGGVLGGLGGLLGGLSGLLGR